MKVILQQDVKGQGKKGQMVEVSDGYARKWCLRPESNWRHADFQSAALPTELPRQRRNFFKWRKRRELNPRSPA